MKIGIFDSGLGGLIIAKAIRKAMPEYDYVYLGDTKRVPYGNRSHEAVFDFTRECVDYLFKKENCAIVIVACNTASARALRQLQQEYLPKNFPDRKILGVLIPTAEECANFGKIGVLGTRGTIESNSFPIEILARRSFSEGGKKSIKIFQNPAPMLVPLAEEGETKNALPFIKEYLKPFANKKLDAVALGCTHYPIFKKEIKLALRSLGVAGKVISQDEIIPKKLKNYFTRHPEISKKLSKKRTVRILVTDMTESVQKLSKKWFSGVRPRLIHLTPPSAPLSLIRRGVRGEI